MHPAPKPLAFGVSMVGPVIYTFGNEAQKSYLLPRSMIGRARVFQNRARAPTLHR